MKRIQRPTRFGRALRRLKEGKTAHVVYHIALKMEEDGLVSVDRTPSAAQTSSGSRSALPCKLTEAGEAAAQAALDGKNPYAIMAPQKPRARRFRPTKNKNGAA